MPDRCVIVSGGECSPICTGESDFVIACDRGYEYAKNAGIVPNLAVGDFDSYSGEIGPETPVRKFQCEKDDTDTMIAVRYAVEHGYRELAMFCALGGRFDHAYANLQAAAYAAENGLNVSIYGKDTEIYVLCNGKKLLPRREGYSLSLFSYSGHCQGVSAQGVKYSLNDAVLTSTFPIGVSNEWNSEQAAISVRDGILFIILSKLIQ